MNFILTLAYLFFVGSVSGWVLELFFRKFFSASNPEHKWINPGFCTGPYLPIYGFGLCALYLLALLGRETGLDGSIQGRALLFLGMAVSMTLIEYIGGLLPTLVAYTVMGVGIGDRSSPAFWIAFGSLGCVNAASIVLSACLLKKHKERGKDS